MSPIDQLLNTAVESGAVPQIVAVAADRDGIYQGAAGPRVPGTDDPVGFDSVPEMLSTWRFGIDRRVIQGGI